MSKSIKRPDESGFTPKGIKTKHTDLVMIAPGAGCAAGEV
jgi:hypothetical protein